MNRQEALFTIDAIRSIMRDEGLLVDGDNWSDVLTNLAECIKPPQPDSDTGLLPCGCGGKAKCLHHLTPDGDYAVKCGKCKIMTDWFNSPEDAIKAFNTAMGWKGGAE